MAGAKKKYNLSEALDFILDSDTDYNEELSSDESSDEDCDPCYRVTLDFIADGIVNSVDFSSVSSFLFYCSWIFLGSAMFSLFYILVIFAT